MGLPVRAAQVLGQSTLNSGEAEDSFRVMRNRAVPEAPKVIECGVTLSVEEGMLQTICLVAGKAITDAHHVPRLEPLGLAYHRHEGVFLAFPGHPVVPADIRPSHGFVANIKLRFECERMADGVGSLSEGRGDAFERVKIDAVSVDVFEQLGDCDPWECSFVAGSSVPGEDGEEYFYAATVKLIYHLPDRGDPAGQIAQKVELVAIVHSQVGINGPDQDGIDRADPAFRVSEKPVNRIFAGFRIVKTSVPDEKLYLGDDLLGPCQFGTLVLRAIVAQTDEAFSSPHLQAVAPCLGVSRVLRSGEKDFIRQRKLGQIHDTGWRNQRVTGLPFAGKGKTSGKYQAHDCG